jgi:hypothetical protein
MAGQRTVNPSVEVRLLPREQNLHLREAKKIADDPTDVDFFFIVDADGA